MDETQAVRSLGALAQETRLRIFRALVAQGPEGLTPGHLSETLGVASTALSFHLKELSHAGLVTQRRDGRHLIYRAEFGAMNDLLQFLTAHCCQGEPCEVTTGSSAVPTCTTC
ncbi:MAG: metalloregulator ArsR/SmtB family transcription factor [Hydrogenophaga sp.]|uniref:ArsR/SmtB family transcription factor n=1 Tax=Hydrogenophaga sp. TaxID=1904254 RepID=UPI0026309BE4|nr:metalloregulator ArsR/SmtB family transcription factor [Hydrogenophaga sp.]MDM7942622.1 metalloregulator ArsR/SmtB family transcription factor [Hydrogenophaga sp.]